MQTITDPGRQPIRSEKEASRSAPVIEVHDLCVSFKTEDGVARAVDGVSFEIAQGETLALVGESGCGKSVTSLAIMGLLPIPPGNISHGRVLYAGRDLLLMPKHQLHRIRGNEISMVFQEPMTSLNPVFTVGEQIAEAVMLHKGRNRREALAAATEMLELVKVPDPGRIARSYPHQLSGGMRQRVMIAMALSCGPKLLIADEPTTALDVTTQAQILDLIRKLQQELGTAILFITHDLGVVAEVADRVVVMYAGRIVEEAPVAELLANPRMPYTAALLGSIPHLDRAGGVRHGRVESIPGSLPDPLDSIAGCSFELRCRHATEKCKEHEPALERIQGRRKVRCHYWHDLDLASSPKPAAREPRPLEKKHDTEPEADASFVRVEGLETKFPIRGGLFYRIIGNVAAVRGVSLDVRRGEVLGLVGESGSGKTTLGRNLLGLIEPTAGRVVFDGQEVTAAPPATLKALRRRMQMVFQDPYGSLNPRMTVGDILSEPYIIHHLAAGGERADRVSALLERVGLSPDHAGRFPHEFSGGQRQRVGIARALAVQPSFLVADEPVSALDVSVQAQILNLLGDLKADLALTVLFIAHDLGVVAYLADRVAVMYLGRIVEIGPTRSIYENPIHPYTEALLSAVPVLDSTVRPTRVILGGEVPNPASPPSGCAFHTRCPIATRECTEIDPPLEKVTPGHFKACIRRPA